MTLETTDPLAIRLSIEFYGLLQKAYPAGFRREYGPQMLQVFRDCCRTAVHRSGPPGLAQLWALTLFDWFKTVIEERLNQATEMTLAKWIRLSGWGLLIGPLALFIGMGDPVAYRRLLITWIGAPLHGSDQAAYLFATETIPQLVAMIGMGLISFGLWGLHIACRGKVGRLGRFGLRIGAASSVVALIGGVLSLTGGEAWWLIFLGGLLFTFLSLAIFGVDVLREKPFTRWNALPILTGFGLPALLAISIFMGLEDHPYILVIPLAFSLLGLIGLGWVLQSDASGLAGRKDRSDIAAHP